MKFYLRWVLFCINFMFIGLEICGVITILFKFSTPADVSAIGALLKISFLAIGFLSLAISLHFGVIALMVKEIWGGLTRYRTVQGLLMASSIYKSLEEENVLLKTENNKLSVQTLDKISKIQSLKTDLIVLRAQFDVIQTTIESRTRKPNLP